MKHTESIGEDAVHWSGSGARHTLLIVDDEPAARLAMAAMVYHPGLGVSFACSAEEARDRMDAIDPDVVVCDLMMEEMGGDELIRWMKSHERWRVVPIIAVTQLDSLVVRADLLRSGADSVMSKADAPRILQAQVCAALRLRAHYRLAQDV